MKNYIFLVGGYYPYFSAVGNCCFNIAEELVKSNKVTVICIKSTPEQINEEIYEHQHIIRVSHKWLNVRLKLENQIRRERGLRQKIYRLLLTGVRAKYYASILSSQMSLNKDLVNAYLDAFNRIEDKIDIIIPLSFPMETVVAGMEYQRNHEAVKLIPYIFDPFAEDLLLHRTNWNRKLKMKQHLELEKEMMKLSTKVFCVNHISSHLSDLNEFQQKIIPTEHPLLKKNENISYLKTEVSDKEIKMIYAGVFHKYIRNPDYYLKTMTNVLFEIGGELHLYYYGNCGDIVKKYLQNSKGKIVNHGYVPKSEVDVAISNSNIMTCVGNRNNLQAPSKLIECIATGKPIVFFYSICNDINLDILRNYPLKLCLKQDETLFKENVEKLVCFCEENKNKSLDFDEVKKIYYYASPAYIAGQIMATVNDIKKPQIG